MDAAFVLAIGFFQHVVDFGVAEALAQVFHDVAQIGGHDPALPQFIKHPVAVKLNQLNQSLVKLVALNAHFKQSPTNGNVAAAAAAAVAATANENRMK